MCIPAISTTFELCSKAYCRYSGENAWLPKRHPNTFHMLRALDFTSFGAAGSDHRNRSLSLVGHMKAIDAQTPPDSTAIRAEEFLCKIANHIAVGS